MERTARELQQTGSWNEAMFVEMLTGILLITDAPFDILCFLLTPWDGESIHSCTVYTWESGRTRDDDHKKP